MEGVNVSDNELLLVISDMMDNNLKSLNDKNNKIETDMNHGLKKINVILENEIRPDLKLLAESYLPSAIRYEKVYLKLRI